MFASAFPISARAKGMVLRASSVPLSEMAPRILPPPLSVPPIENSTFSTWPSWILSESLPKVTKVPGSTADSIGAVN